MKKIVKSTEIEDRSDFPDIDIDFRSAPQCQEQLLAYLSDKYEVKDLAFSILKKTIKNKMGVPGFPYGENLLGIKYYGLKLDKGMQLELYYNPDGIESEMSDGHSEYFILGEDMMGEEVVGALINGKDTTITYSEEEEDWDFRYSIDVIFPHQIVDYRANEDETLEFVEIKKGYVRL